MTPLLNFVISVTALPGVACRAWMYSAMKCCLFHDTGNYVPSVALQVGDRVAVTRKDDGALHFYVNGADQGRAATNVPANVYGAIDVYGCAEQVTIVAHKGK